MLWVLVVLLLQSLPARAELLAGVAKRDITDPNTPSNDPLFVRALVLKQQQTVAVLITVDAVSIGGIGHIRDSYLTEVRAALQDAPGITPLNVFVNASHCHGVVCADVASLTIEAVREAWGRLEPVKAGVGVGQEVRIMENRRLRLSDGSEADVRVPMPFRGMTKLQGLVLWIRKLAFCVWIGWMVAPSLSSITLPAIRSWVYQRG